jgi:formamidopyrimidine-DNA glycosylase
MPELPDVAGFQTYLNATALHQPIARTRVLDQRILGQASPALIARRLKGSTLDQTHRHGKFLFARVQNAGWLVLHFGMTGQLKYEGSPKDLPEYARLAIVFSNGSRLSYLCRRMLGQVDFTDELDAFVQQQDLGPDALDDSVTRKRLAERLSDRRGSLKGLLLDQSFIAGVGNVWADEVLFQAGLDPRSRADHLSDDQVASLYRALRRVMKTGAKHNGRIDRLPDDWLLGHRETGHPCPRCGGRIETVTVLGRSSYVCPNCQKRV